MTFGHHSSDEQDFGAFSKKKVLPKSLKPDQDVSKRCFHRFSKLLLISIYA